ncbi:MAG TPA: DUF1385 domain-containing protein [Candidatus Faecousia intestinigallinarum]|nr:DUF1385 domain-containing protein [Candidatus Faecousia intestinigallinarum]
MSRQTPQPCCEKFKTMIGGQALIEGIMMRGPEKDAIVVRGKDGLEVEVKPRKLPPRRSILRWPLIRGVVNFFDSQVVGVKALLRSADLSPEEYTEEPSKLDKWLEKKLGNAKFQNFLLGTAVALGLGMSIVLFFLLPMIISSFFDQWITSNLGICLLEGLIRIGIFLAYMFAISRMKEMRRLFAYHGAEHKTIRCYEAGLPLTVENVRRQTRLHPRCGTSFLLVILVLSILIFSMASAALLAAVPALEAMRGSFWYRVVMIVFKLLLIPLVVAIGYEINRWVGRHDNLLSKILTAPGMWFQNFTTNEPDDSMIEVGIAAVQAVLPQEAGADRW